MNISKYIIIFFILISCSKEKQDNPENTITFEWPTNSWVKNSLKSVNLKADFFTNLQSKIRNGDYENIHSLLVIKDGFLVFEDYFNGSSAQQVHQLQSVTKSIASVVCGIAMDQNYFNESDFVLNHIDNSYIHDNDALRNSISIKHMLDMRLGIEWQEWWYDADEKDNFLMIETSDWLQYLLDKPMTSAPGNEFIYNTGASLFISALLESETTQGAKKFSEEFLFTPIGIESQNWWLEDSKGLIHTGGGLSLTAQDMARFGFLILRDGIWDETQIISDNYLNKINNPINTNIISIPVNGNMQPLHYGYHWWNIPLQVNNKNFNLLTAMGVGGQFIFICKELDLVVVTTPWNLTEPFQSSTPVEWLKEYIIPAAL